MGYIPPSEADKRYVMVIGDTMAGILAFQNPGAVVLGQISPFAFNDQELAITAAKTLWQIANGDFNISEAPNGQVVLAGKAGLATEIRDGGFFGTIIAAFAAAGHDMKNHRLMNVAAPTADTDAATQGSSVKKTGDTMTGNLTIAPPANVGPILTLTGTGTGGGNLFLDSAAGVGNYVRHRTGSLYRWLVGKNTAAEAGADAGSDYQIIRYNDAGVSLGAPLSISRQTGVVTLTQQPTVAASEAEADIAMASGWAHYGSGYGNCKVTRFGNQVILQGLPKRTSDLVPVAGTYYTVGTVPDGFLPDVTVYDISYYNGGTTTVRVAINPAGTVSVAFISTATIVSGGWLPLNTGWRAA